MPWAGWPRGARHDRKGRALMVTQNGKTLAHMLLFMGACLIHPSLVRATQEALRVNEKAVSRILNNTRLAKLGEAWPAPAGRVAEPAGPPSVHRGRPRARSLLWDRTRAGSHHPGTADSLAGCAFRRHGRGRGDGAYAPGCDGARTLLFREVEHAVRGSTADHFRRGVAVGCRSPGRDSGSGRRRRIGVS